MRDAVQARRPAGAVEEGARALQDVHAVERLEADPPVVEDASELQAVEQKLQSLFPAAQNRFTGGEEIDQRWIHSTADSGTLMIRRETAQQQVWSAPIWSVRLVRMITVGLLILAIGQLLRRWRFLDWVQAGFWRCWLILSLPVCILFPTSWPLLPVFTVAGLAIGEHLFRWLTAPPKQILVN